MNAHESASRLPEWLHRIDEASSSDQIAYALTGIRASDEWRVADTADRARVAQAAVDSLHGLGADAQAADLLVAVLDDLMGRLLSPPEAEDAWDLHRAREALAGLLNDVAEAGDCEPRDDALSRVVAALGGAADIEAPARLAGAIGLRTDAVVDALTRVLAPPNAASQADVAASVLSILALSGQPRERVVDYVRERASGAPSQSVIHATAWLGDLEALKRLWRSADWGISPNDPRSPAHTLPSVAGDVASSHGSDRHAQEDLWNLILEWVRAGDTKQLRRLYWMGGVASSIDSPRVVPFLLGSVAAEASADQRWQCYRRLQECTQPRQLASWARVGVSPGLERMRADRAADADPEGRGDTAGRDRKTAAWDLLFRASEAPSTEAATQALANETSESVCRDLCEMLACFDIGDLPPPITGWITEDHDEPLQGGGARGPHHWRLPLGAEMVAGSSSSLGAFEALLRPGFTFEGHLQQSTAGALCDVAQTLALSGHTEVADRLLDRIENQGTLHRHRAAAGAAVERLAGTGHLEDSHFERLLDLIPSVPEDPKAGDFCRGQVVAALGTRMWQGDTLGDRVADELGRIIAAGPDGHVYWQALETMARTRGLLQYPVALSQTLGLTEAGGRWTIDDPAKWRDGTVDSFIFALAFAHDPVEMLPAALRLMEEGSRETAWDLIRVVVHEEGRQRLRSLPREFLAALAARSAKWGGRGLLRALRRLAPEEFAATPWEEHCGAWSPAERAALAAELGRLAGVSGEAVVRAVRVLARLAGDGTYEVRRSAYRALALLSQDSLRALCTRWLRRGRNPIGVRKRGAEACCWLVPRRTGAEVDATTYSRAATDPEGRVREAAERCLKERREREWARHYVRRVCQAESGATEEVLAAWPYGEALGHMGDDETVYLLWDLPPRAYLPPNVRHWRKRIEDAVENRWDSVKRDWPKPWRECEMPGLD